MLFHNLALFFIFFVKVRIKYIPSYEFILVPMSQNIVSIQFCSKSIYLRNIRIYKDVETISLLVIKVRDNSGEVRNFMSTFDRYDVFTKIRFLPHPAVQNLGFC